MSQFLRPVRSFLSRRAPAHVASGQPVVIQRVKLSRGGRIKRALTVFVVSYSLFSLYETVVFGPLFKALDDYVEDDGHDRDDDEEELEPFFIPLPFTTQQIDPIPYSGKDPEWQEFIKASKDKEFQQRIRQNLAGIVLNVASTSAMLTARFGKDLKIRRSWMDVDYPYRPPPEFERAGILIDDEIKLARQEVDPNIVTLTQRILYPTPLLWASMAFTTTLMKQNANDVAKMFGWEVKQAPSIFGPGTQPPGAHQQLPAQGSSVQKTLQRIREESTRRPEEVKDPAEMVARKTQTEDQQAEKTPGHSASNSSTRTDRPVVSHSPHEAVTTDRLSSLDRIRSLTGNGPWDAFKGTWAKKFKPTRPHPPRGSFLVSGLVELETSRATIVVDVAAWYNPATKRYDSKSMYLGVRRVQMKTQSPLR
ncbi:hypothetical protein GQ53DRAFT_742795 [Thozetella sp. PMI_491]|nr:hypothetical protein GQ53DRAFT_742795 [Thozetella sp. PMI_491]